MPSRPRRIIAGAGLAAGLLVGSIAPAAALPREPNDRHCERIERFEDRAEARIDRLEARIVRAEAMIERFEDRAEARPARADRFERAIARMQARIDRLEGRIGTITERYNAIAEHCGLDPLGGEPAGDTTDDTTGGEEPTEAETPVDNTLKPDVGPATST